MTAPGGDVPDHRASDSGPTLGEIGRRITDLSDALRNLRADLSSTYVRKDVYDAHRAADAKELETAVTRIDAIEAGKKWGVRTIVSSVVAVGGTLVTTLLAVKFGLSQ